MFELALEFLDAVCFQNMSSLPRLARILFQIYIFSNDSPLKKMEKLQVLQFVAGTLAAAGVAESLMCRCPHLVSSCLVQDYQRVRQLRSTLDTAAGEYSILQTFPNSVVHFDSRKILLFATSAEGEACVPANIRYSCLVLSFSRLNYNKN
jgi:hypothetical protein